MTISPILADYLPGQTEGSESNTQTKKKCAGDEQAKELYQQVVRRMFNVNRWHQYAGTATAEFQLYDSAGNTVDRAVQEGDYFQINIPGPNRATGDGKDWVQVQKVENHKGDNFELSYFTVRPSTQPNSPGNDKDHFFSSSATSTFLVLRNNQEVIAGVYGRNEKPNVSKKSIIDNFRNALIAIGAMLGFSNAQWKALTYGWIHSRD